LSRSMSNHPRGLSAEEEETRKQGGRSTAFTRKQGVGYVRRKPSLLHVFYPSMQLSRVLNRFKTNPCGSKLDKSMVIILLLYPTRIDISIVITSKGDGALNHLVDAVVVRFIESPVPPPQRLNLHTQSQLTPALLAPNQRQVHTCSHHHRRRMYH